MTNNAVKISVKHFSHYLESFVAQTAYNNKDDARALVTLFLDQLAPPCPRVLQIHVIFSFIYLCRKSLAIDFSSYQLIPLND